MRQCNKPAAVAIGTIALAVAAILAGSSAAGTGKEESFSRVEVKTQANGDQVVATVKVTGRGGFGCNLLYPWRLTLTPGPGVEMPKTTYGKGDAKVFTRDAVIFEVRYSAGASAGEIKARLRLSVCNEKQCQMEQVDLAWPAR